MLENKYPCFNCKGTGRIDIHSVEGNFARGCDFCGGTGRRRVTIPLEEYKELKKS